VNTRRQFLIQAPLGLLGAAVACGGNAPQSQTPATPTAGAPPTFGTAPEVGPEVTTATFAEAEKLARVTMTPAERTMAAATWRKTIAPMMERRTGPRTVALEPEVSPATRWTPIESQGHTPPTRDHFVRATVDPARECGRAPLQIPRRSESGDGPKPDLIAWSNIGLAADTALKDVGRMKITNDPKDSLKFKVPSLRNVAVSSPYMHDGRFWYISQCIRHYRDGIQQSPTLDAALKKGMQLSERDIADINSFLRTLTDSSFLKNPRYADPENKPILSPDVH